MLDHALPRPLEYAEGVECASDGRHNCEMIYRMVVSLGCVTMRGQRLRCAF